MSKKTTNNHNEECANCAVNSVKLFSCSRCRNIKYCSISCQTQHWKEDHKIYCKSHNTERNNDGKYIQGKIYNCAICYDDIDKSELMTTECYHNFHKKCIIEVYKTDNKCPLCRMNLSLQVNDIIKKLEELYTKDKEKYKKLIEKLIESLKQLANRNNPKAQFELGVIYLKEKFLKSNNKTGIEYLIKAANQGLLDAQINLGNLYYYGNGNGIDQNYILAYKYYSMAAEQDHTISQSQIGCLYYLGQGVIKNYEMAFKYYYLAAEKNHVNAQYNIGLMYYKGCGVNQDYGMAYKYYLLAANHGHYFAQNNLGNLYRSGEGVDQDYKKARYYYLKSAEQNNSPALLSLGDLYFHGYGVNQDNKIALEYYTKALKYNDPKAQSSFRILSKINLLYQIISGTSVD